MRKILFIGLVVTVVLISGCYGPTTSPNATVQPTGGTPSVTPVMTPVETTTPFIISTPVETITPIGTATSVGITNITETPYATGTSYVTPVSTYATPASTYATPASTYATPASTYATPASTYSYATTPVSTVTGTVATVNKVNITSSGYNPAIISVPSGTMVTWTNTDTVSHTVTSNTGDFDSGSLGSGQTFSWTFSKSGSYDYGDSSNSSMSGTVVVT